MSILEFFGVGTSFNINRDKLKDFKIKLLKLRGNGKLKQKDIDCILTFVKEKCPITKTKYMHKMYDEKILKEIKTLCPEFIRTKKEFKSHIKEFKKSTNLTWTKDQRKAIKNFFNLLYKNDRSTLGIYGFAGSGKTRVIVEIIRYLLKKNLLTRVAMSAPTNKATNVMKSNSKYFIKDTKDKKGKSSEDLEKISFLTIHKLLQFENDVSNDGTKIFIRKKKKSITGKYQLVVIDECSMIQKDMIKMLKEDIDELQKKNNLTKVCYTGDPAQLNPVKEGASLLFSSKKYNPEKTLTMKKIVRNQDKSVNKFSKAIRKWVFDEKKVLNPCKYASGKVKINIIKKRSESDQINRKGSSWFKKFLSKEYINNSIILTWTNKQSDLYNKWAREEIFKTTDLKKYMVGDKLIISDFYKIPEMHDTKNAAKLYTSEQVMVSSVKKENKIFQKINVEFPSKAEKLLNADIIKTKYLKCVQGINRLLRNVFSSWSLTVRKINDYEEESDKSSKNSKPAKPEKEFFIYALHEESKEQFDKDREYANNLIQSFWKYCKKYHSGSSEKIERIILKPLWMSFHKIFNDHFATVSYGFSTTTHVSQGSTYKNVFVDQDDILLNYNREEGRRCYYTAVTRASNEVHILASVEVKEDKNKNKKFKRKE